LDPIHEVLLAFRSEVLSSRVDTSVHVHTERWVCLPRSSCCLEWTDWLLEEVGDDGCWHFVCFAKKKKPHIMSVKEDACHCGCVLKKLKKICTINAYVQRQKESIGFM
jgi:hypothetical protein